MLLSFGKQHLTGYRFACKDCRCGERASRALQPTRGSTGLDEPEPPSRPRPHVTSTANSTVIVSAASEDHLCALVNLLTSLQEAAPETPVLIWDLSPTPAIKASDLHAVHRNVVGLRHFPYKDYPDHFNVQKSGGHWAWKVSPIRFALHAQLIDAHVSLPAYRAEAGSTVSCCTSTARTCTTTVTPHPPEPC